MNEQDTSSGLLLQQQTLAINALVQAMQQQTAAITGLVASISELIEIVADDAAQDGPLSVGLDGRTL